MVRARQRAQHSASLRAITARQLQALLGSSIPMRVGSLGHPPPAAHGHSGSSEQPKRAQGSRAVLAGHQPLHEAPRLPDQERSEEHTSELQSLAYLVCRLLLEKKKKKIKTRTMPTYTPTRSH